MKWEKIKGYEGYLISDTGKVYSEKTKRILKGRKTKDGYIYYRLSNKSKGQFDVKAHRLVASAYIPNPNDLDTVNHKDGNKGNNSVNNLEWADRHEQLLHAYKLGLKKAQKGTNNCNSKCTKEQVELIRNRYDNHKGSFYGFFADLSRELGVSQTIVTRIAKRKTYIDISCVETIENTLIKVRE